MVAKIIGGALVLISCVFGGAYMSMRSSFRANELESLRRAFLILISEIEFSNPLREACQNVAERVPCAASKIFAAFADLIQEQDGSRACDLWERAVRAHAGGSQLSPSDAEMLLSFGKTFGYLDTTMQLNNIGLALKYIDNETTLLSEKSSNDKKLYLNLGVLGGLMLVIVLI
ncbi:hypothetical protein AGMMS49975_01270 [Clostridia bacterium]|nr:hypothetical protein AGMMS49975_01270 [Clostridia bacterium]